MIYIYVRGELTPDSENIREENNLFCKLNLAPNQLKRENILSVGSKSKSFSPWSGENWSWPAASNNFYSLEVSIFFWKAM